MDKKCEGCKYKKFSIDNKISNYGFCTNENVKFLDYSSSNKMKIKSSKEYPDLSPSCLNVQSYYHLVKYTECPYYETDCSYYEIRKKGKKDD